MAEHEHECECAGQTTGHTLSNTEGSISVHVGECETEGCTQLLGDVTVYLRDGRIVTSDWVQLRGRRGRQLEAPARIPLQPANR
jgi:hypothetical protein